MRSNATKARRASQQLPQRAVRAPASASSGHFDADALIKPSSEMAVTFVRVAAAGATLVIGVYFAMHFIGQFQIYLTAAGLALVLLTVASSVYEFSQTRKQQQVDASDVPVVVHEPSLMSPNVPSVSTNETQSYPPVHMPTLEYAGETKTSKRLEVVHCGTVIDLNGSQGFIMRHELENKKVAKKVETYTPDVPLVIPFQLPSSNGMELSIGGTVEFACAKDDSRVQALHVTPIASAEEEITRSRNALLSCKKARRASFARAMEELTTLSPRPEPLKESVDLIQYAAQLDEDEQFI